jgi:nitroreductase
MSTIALNLETDTVPLPPPVLPSGVSLEDALKGRSSARAFLPDSLPLETLSGLLWAGFGINRPGGRTAPSAHNLQEIDIFVRAARRRANFIASAVAARFARFAPDARAPGSADGHHSTPLRVPAARVRVETLRDGT